MFQKVWFCTLLAWWIVSSATPKKCYWKDIRPFVPLCLCMSGTISGFTGCLLTHVPSGPHCRCWMPRLVLKHLRKGSRCATPFPVHGWCDLSNHKRLFGIFWFMMVPTLFLFFFIFFPQIQPRLGEKSAAICREWPRNHIHGKNQIILNVKNNSSSWSAGIIYEFSQEPLIQPRIAFSHGM